MMPVIYGNSYRIVQAPGVVAISYEMIHETRVIPVDAAPRVGAAARAPVAAPRLSAAVPAIAPRLLMTVMLNSIP